ncbi:hypothetical protein SUGI_0064910 [Cryptomeria japonica]|nr:hypothetical protein SUGI_0064910 [Cryptomeria japonica]
MIVETPLSRSGEKGAPESNPRPLEPSPPRPLSLGDWFLISPSRTVIIRRNKTSQDTLGHALTRDTVD